MVELAAAAAVEVGAEILGAVAAFASVGVGAGSLGAAAGSL